ncbi:hypothetical protein H7J77_12410 [Mycolicibacillus parakoreensis]|uniref:Uncharacterized protein n=1 Tax=Mycolicibacillus parakoreensis TaxID=1069221 RepID=A0ABY3U3M8_9MYCO|nr:hypothetical protein [Mycolicibacillus parakoreensis]MCV7316339.1 hypothetical protein [Mycolicibacillus parakoreensis]ULN52585.1 hypothetical protein MIU77_17390 [Mycolicibacillus parakoreensis]
MSVVIRKLLGIGKLPDDLREQLEAEGLIHLVDYVAVTRRFSGAIPGMRSTHSVASYVGSVAFSSHRVLATLSALPKMAGRTVDVRWDQPQGGAATVAITESGLSVDVDLDESDPRFHGRLELDYKTELPASVLDRLPARTLRFDVPPEYVFRAVGVAYHP